MSELSKVTGALSQEQRDRIYQHYTGINERWRGAGVGDILYVLYQTDAHADILEPFWEKYTNMLPWTPAVNYAAYAIIGLGEELTLGRVRGILSQAEIVP